MTMTEQELACQWCGSATDLGVAGEGVKLANPQVDLPHTLFRCARCGQLSLGAKWGNQRYLYKGLEYKRPFRRPTYVAIFPVACAWCERRDKIEPEEINATVANPASQRHKYDIYACHACERYTAVSYLGEVYAYPATQDERYATLYYLELGEE
jgi:hypothetical protein